MEYSKVGQRKYPKQINLIQPCPSDWKNYLSDLIVWTTKFSLLTPNISERTDVYWSTENKQRPWGKRAILFFPVIGCPYDGPALELIAEMHVLLSINEKKLFLGVEKTGQRGRCILGLHISERTKRGVLFQIGSTHGHWNFRSSAQGNGYVHSEIYLIQLL